MLPQNGMSLELPSLGFTKVASIIRRDACVMGRGAFEMKPLLYHSAILLCSKIKICNFFCHNVLFTITFFHNFFHKYCWKKLSLVFLVLVLSVHLKSKKRCCCFFNSSTVFFPIGDDSWLIKYS